MRYGLGFIYNFTFCPHSVFVCFVCISEQIAITSLYSINWLVFITQTECVHCVVRTGPISKLSPDLKYFGLPLLMSGFDPGSVHVRFGEQCGTETGFSPRTSFFPCHYDSTSALYSSSLHVADFRRSNWQSLGNPKKQCTFENRGKLDRQVHSLECLEKFIEPKSRRVLSDVLWKLYDCKCCVCVCVCVKVCICWFSKI